MKLSKKNWIDIGLVVLIAVLVFSPLMNYIKRNFFPNNELVIEAKNPLDENSLNLELKGYNTKDLKLKNTKGKVVFLHIWGTWCPDCRLELPSVQEFYNAHKQDIEFVLIDWEKNQKYDKLNSFIEEYGYTVPMYVANSPISKQLEVQQFPTTFIIDKEGNIVSKHQGATDWTLPEVQKPILDLVN